MTHNTHRGLAHNTRGNPKYHKQKKKRKPTFAAGTRCEGGVFLTTAFATCMIIPPSGPSGYCAQRTLIGNLALGIFLNRKSR